MQRHLKIVLVAAVAENGIIGCDNSMPWHVPSDLKRFKAMTLGRPVVMGRKTYESLGRPLPGRFNILVSRGMPDLPEGVACVGSLEAGLALAAERAELDGVEEIMIIGGGQLYSAAMPLAHRLEITRVHATPQGDTVFPEIDPAVWVLTASTPGLQGERDTAGVSYLTFERRPDSQLLPDSGCAGGDDRHDG